MPSETAVLPAQQPAFALIIVFYIQIFLGATRHKQSVHWQTLQNIQTFLQNEPRSFFLFYREMGPQFFFSLKKNILKKLVSDYKAPTHATVIKYTSGSSRMSAVAYLLYFLHVL